MKKQWVQPGRLALRVEGDFWNAYFAGPESMIDAVLLGSIKLRLVEENETRKSQFMALMREAFSDIVESICGQRPVWPEPEGHTAPEHERSGNA